MSPTYTMSAHLCKQIYASWRQTRQTSPEPVATAATNHSSAATVIANAPTTSTAGGIGSYFSRASTPEKRSMDSERSDSSAMSRQSSSSSYKSGGK